MTIQRILQNQLSKDDHIKEYTKSLTYQFLKKIVMEIKLISQQNFDFELQFLLKVKILIFGLLEPDGEPTIVPFVTTNKFENLLN
jgi:hypothetical protein